MDKVLTERSSSPVQLSIVVPITKMHNRLGLLRKWITEIDFQNIEVILVHDLQDEFTSIDLLSLVTEFPLIRILEKTFLSAGLARNAGLKIARADWILFWDCDDEPSVSGLSEFIEHPNKESFDLFIFNFRIEKNGTVSNNQTRSWKDLAINPGIWRIVFSRSTISNHSFPSFPLGEDQYFLAQLQVPTRRTRFVNEFLYTYKIGMTGQATTNNSNIPRLKESLFALNSIRTHQKGDNLEFTCILYWRQILTLLKRGSISIRIESISMILCHFLRINSNYLVNLKALAFVLRKLMVRHV